MATLENIRQSLDEIGETLVRLGNENPTKSISVAEFHKQVTVFFPDISYTPPESMWEDDQEVEDNYRPPWWDDLDEPFELDEYFWLVPFQKMELLTPNEVRELMDNIEAGVLAEEAVINKVHEDLISKYGLAKFHKLIDIGSKSFELMITRNLKLVFHVARKYTRKVSIEDAFSFGVFGLLQAVKKFDWRLGNQFSTYATWWLRQSITREFADTGTTINIPVHAVERANNYERELREFLRNEYTTGGDVTVRNCQGEILRVEPAKKPLRFKPEIDNTLACALEAKAPAYDFWDVYYEAPWLLADYETPDNSVSHIEFGGIARDLATRLTDYVVLKRDLDVFFYRHGFIGGEALTLDEIGKIYGFTRERARQIESKVVETINLFLDGVTLDNYWERIDQAVEKYYALVASAKVSKKKNHTLRITEAELGTAKRAKRVIHAHEGSRFARRKALLRQPQNAEILSNANKERSAKASANQVAQVSWALRNLGSVVISDQWLQIAKARIENPSFSLSELASKIGEGVTKDVVSGTLRRLIQMASKVSGESPPKNN